MQSASTYNELTPRDETNNSIHRIFSEDEKCLFDVESFIYLIESFTFVTIFRTDTMNVNTDTDHDDK